MVNLNEGDNWREWLNAWGDRFLLFARQQTASFSEAEDIVQEAFVRIWTKREAFPTIQPGLVFTQIKRIAINRARSELRRRRREESFANDNHPMFYEDDSQGLGAEIQVALQTLPVDQREVIVLKVWGEQTFESIAATLEISPNTAASRYRYGMEHLRKVLKGKFS